MYYVVKNLFHHLHQHHVSENGFDCRQVEGFLQLGQNLDLLLRPPHNLLLSLLLNYSPSHLLSLTT